MARWYVRAANMGERAAKNKKRGTGGSCWERRPWPLSLLSAPRRRARWCEIARAGRWDGVGGAGLGASTGAQTEDRPALAGCHLAYLLPW